MKTFPQKETMSLVTEVIKLVTALIGLAALALALSLKSAAAPSDGCLVSDVKCERTSSLVAPQ